MRGHRAYAFGTWKIEVLGRLHQRHRSAGHRGAHDLPVGRATGAARRPSTTTKPSSIAVVGLAVNLLCAWWLRDSRSCARSRPHDHDHHRHAHADVNMRSAYMHAGGRGDFGARHRRPCWAVLLWGAAWLDPLMGAGGRGAGGGLGRGDCCATRAGCCSMRKWTRRVVAEVREVIERGAVPAAHHRSARCGGSGAAKYAGGAERDHDVATRTANISGALCVHEELAHVTVEVDAKSLP